jgi:phospholipid-binding lipoprotein MlaA
LRSRLLYAAIGVSIELGFAIGGRPAAAATPGDPFEATNRRIYASSSAADRRFLLPLSRLYQRLTPGVFGKALHNIFTNLSEPEVIANYILQARLKQAAHEGLRFVANSTAGCLGIIDVAGRSGLAHHDNDFGVTMGVWGVKPGPYLYLPVLGPSTVRDAIGKGADLLLDPLTYIRYPYRRTVSITVNVLSGLDQRARAEADLEPLLSGAADPYATLRSVYLQNREAMVRGEAATPPLPPLDEPAPGSAPSAEPPPAQITPSALEGVPLVQPPPPTVVSVNDDAPVLIDFDAPIRTARRADFEGGPPAQLAAN